VITRDLARDPVPHLDAVRFRAFLAQPEARDAARQEPVAYSDRLIDGLKQADLARLAARAGVSIEWPPCVYR
jgi:FMN-dependent NADH-azoreductase